MSCRLVVVAICVAITGCIEPTLTRCGDQSCPDTAVCLVDRCVAPGQLEACTNKVDGESCAVNDRVGACSAGVCEFVGCGNGVVEAGELCDDGNAAYGDGCSADCGSLETCGNGVVDFAIGESCDCGTDDATRPIQCASVNSGSEAAQCTNDCHLRYCGDGTLNVLEQCDGTTFGAASCVDYGYYHGGLSCSDGCLVELGQCYGRCGDDDIEPAFGEFCDGAPPAGTCLTYGFDAGYVDCSTACSADTSECERFGLVQLEARAVLSFVVNDGGRSVIVSSVFDGGTNAWIAKNELRALAPAGTYTHAAGDGVKGYVVGAAHMAEWSGTAWNARTVAWSSGTPTGAWANATGLYVAVGGTVWRYAANTWTDQALTGVTGLAGSSTEVFAWTTNTVFSTSGGAWTAETLPASFSTPITIFIRSIAGPTWFGAGGAANSKLFRRDVASWTQVPYGGGVIKSARTSAAGDLFLFSTFNGVLRFGAVSGVGNVAVGASGATHLNVTPDGGIAYGGPNGAQLYRTGGWSFTEPILSCCAYGNWENDRFDRFSVTHDDFMVATHPANYSVWTGNDAQLSPIDGYNAADMIAIVALANGDVAFAGPYGIVDIFTYTTYWDPNVYDPDDGSILTTRYITSAVPSRTGGMLAVASEWIVRVASPAVVTELNVPGCDIVMMGDDVNGVVTAVAWYYDELGIVRIDAAGVVTTVTPLDSMPNDLWVGDNGDAVVVGGNQVVKCSQSTCTTETVPANLTLVSGTSLDDLFVGGVWTGLGFSQLTHWNGTRWTAVRLPSNGIADLHVSDSRIYVVDGSARIHKLPRLVKW